MNVKKRLDRNARNSGQENDKKTDDSENSWVATLKISNRTYEPILRRYFSIDLFSD